MVLERRVERVMLKGRVVEEERRRMLLRCAGVGGRRNLLSAVRQPWRRRREPEESKQRTAPKENARTDAVVYRGHQPANVKPSQPFLPRDHGGDFKTPQFGSGTGLNLSTTLDHLNLRISASSAGVTAGNRAGRRTGVSSIAHSPPAVAPARNTLESAEGSCRS